MNDLVIYKIINISLKKKRKERKKKLYILQLLKVKKSRGFFEGFHLTFENQIFLQLYKQLLSFSTITKII